MLKRHPKVGSVSTEVAVGTALAVVALFFAIGLFSDNLSSMMIDKKFNNIFTGGHSKTGYASFKRDYKDTQIEVQVTGEQGLEMLRKRANNKAISLVESPFSAMNANGNSIAYLAKVINIIVGESHLCSYMKKDSNKPCDEDDIGGYNYKIESGSTALTIKKVDKTGNIILQEIKIKADSSVLSALSSLQYNTNREDKVNSAYSDIYTASGKVKNVLPSDILLVDVSQTSTKSPVGFNKNSLITGALETIYKSGIHSLVVKEDGKNPIGYNTNTCSLRLVVCIAYEDNFSPSIAEEYMTEGQGRNDTIRLFSLYLDKINDAAVRNIHTELDSVYGSSVVSDAIKYAYAATYNKFLYNIDAASGPADSTKVAFYNSGKDFLAKGQKSICYTYKFESGPGNDKLGNPDDWAVLAKSYVDSQQLIETYLGNVLLYCNKHSQS